MLTDIMRHQSAAGHDVHIVIINNGIDAVLLQRAASVATVHRIGRPEGSKNLWWWLKYNLTIKRLRADVLHYHTDKCAGFTWSRQRAAVLATVHDTKVRWQYLPILNNLCAISQAVESDMHARYGKVCTLVPNGIETDNVTVKSDWYTGGALRMVKVSNLIAEKKGQDIVIRAVAMLRAEGRDVTVDFVGEGASEQYLRNLAADCGVADAVTFVGRKHREWVYAHLADYDLFVQASRYEGFGLTLAEAMAAKLPVIASDVDGPAEIIGRNNRYGTLFASEDADALAQAIRRYMDAPQKGNTLAATDAYNHVCNQYSVRRTALNYIDYYKKLVDNEQ